MHFADLRIGRNLAGADGPNRLIGNRQLGLAFDALRKRSTELRLNRRNGYTLLAKLQALADAEDNVEAARQGSSRFGLHLFVALALRVTTFGMTNDGERRAGIEQHLR